MVESLGSVEQGGGVEIGSGTSISKECSILQKGIQGIEASGAFSGSGAKRLEVMKASVWCSGSGVPVISSVSRHTLLKNSEFIISCWISFLAVCLVEFSQHGDCRVYREY